MASSGMQSTKQVVIDFKLMDGDAIKNIQALNTKIENLKQTLAGMKAQGLENTQTYIKLQAALKEMEGSVRANQKVLLESVKQQKANGDSLNALRAQLKLARAEYEDLSKAERESAQGDALLKKINDITNALKKGEQAQQDWSRSVGNYASVWDAPTEKLEGFGRVLQSVFGDSLLGKAVTATKTITGFLRDVGKDSKDASANVQAMGKAVTDTAKETQDATTVVENAAQSFKDLGDNAASGKTIVEGFGAAERAAADAAKNMASAETNAATAATSVVKGETQAAKAVGSLGNAFKSGIAGIKSFAAQLWSLMKIPIVAIISAIALVVMKLVDSFKKNDQAMTALQKAFAALKPILQVIEKAFQAIVSVVTKVVEAIGSAVNAIVSWIPGLKDYADANQDIVDSQEALGDAERKYAVESAKRQAEISELRAKSAESDKYTTEQRMEFLQQAMDLEKQELEEKRDIAKEKLRIAEKEAALSIGYTELTAEAYEKLDDEIKNSITDLRVAVIEAEKEFSDGTRRIRSQMASFKKEEEAEKKRQENERKQAAKQAAQTAKERAKIQTQAQQALEDFLVKGLRDMFDREYTETVKAYQRQIDALKTRLKEEANLTKQARADIQRQIVLMEADLALTMGDLRLKQERETENKLLEMRKKSLETQSRLLKDDVDGWKAQAQIDIELNEIDADLLKASLVQPLEEAKKAYDTLVSDLTNLTESELQTKYGDTLIRRGIDTSKGMHEAMMQLQAQYHREMEIEETNYSNAVIAIDAATAKERKRIETQLTKDIHDEEYRRLDAQRKHAEILRQIELGQNYDAYGRNEMAKTQIMLEQSQERLRIAREEAQRMADERTKYTDEELSAMYGSVDEYNNLVAESELKVVDAENAVKDSIKAVADEAARQKQTMLQTTSTIMSSINNILGSMQGLFETLAESDEKYADFATGMALMQILVSTAISIANAIEGATAAGAATGVAAPFTTPAFIVEMVGIVLGALASATTTLMKAKQQKQSAPKFKEGGYVKGAGNGTSDSIHAKLSNGEYVIKKKVVDEYGVDFFDRLNGSKSLMLPKLHFADGGLVQTLSTPNFSTEGMFDYDTMRDVMVEAMSEIQPVVSVKEISSVQKRVQVKESIARQ